MPGSYHDYLTIDGQAGSLNTALRRYLTDIKVAQIDTAGFTDRTVEAQVEGGTAFSLLVSTSSKFYWGFDVKDAVLDAGTVGSAGTRVFKLRIDIAVAASGMGALTWEYSKGGSVWGTLSVTDGTSGFTVSGEVSFTPPGDWAADTVNSISAYYIRVSCASGPSTQPTANFTVLNWTVYDDAVGTNDKVYKSIGEDGTKAIYLRVQDNGTTTATVSLYESWDSGAHTGTNQTLPASGVFVKSTSADGTARNFYAWVDRDVIHAFPYAEVWAGVAHWAVLGWIKNPEVAGDAFGGVVVVPTAATTVANALNGARYNRPSVSSTGHMIQRAATGLGTAVAFGKQSMYAIANTEPGKLPMDSGDLSFTPILLADGNNPFSYRGDYGRDVTANPAPVFGTPYASGLTILTDLVTAHGETYVVHKVSSGVELTIDGGFVYVIVRRVK